MGAEEGRLFAKEGAKVVLGDVLEAEGKAAAEQIRDGGRGGDVRPPRRHQRVAGLAGAVATAERVYGRLDVLVNNAGIGGGNRIEDTTLAEWGAHHGRQCHRRASATVPAIPAMRRARGGSIVNISSQLGLVGMDNSSPQYQASKGAVRLLTKATAIQYAKDGIRANSVHPGPIVTAMTERRRADPEQSRLMARVFLSGATGSPWRSRWACSISPPTRPRSSPGASWSSTAGGPRRSELTLKPIYELAFVNGVGRRVEESGLGLIAGYAFSAPHEDLKLKGK